MLDLVEDFRDDCHNYIMDRYSWEHESDGSYGKGWSMVTKEFDNAIKRLKAIGLQVVYISKELQKDITLKGGTVRTTFKPNIDDKTANFLTGTVDITMRAYIDDDDNHKLVLQKEPNTFGGGRYEFKQKEIPLEKEDFLAALEDAQGDAPKSAPEKPVDTTDEEPVTQEAPKRKRKSSKPADDAESVTPPGEEVVEEKVEETPAKSEPETETEPKHRPRRRRRKSEE